MKYYTFDYEETDYQIYNCSDDVDDESIYLKMPETTENTKAVQEIVILLDKSVGLKGK